MASRGHGRPAPVRITRPWRIATSCSRSRCPRSAETTLYLRYASQGPVDINLSLLAPNQLAEALSREQIAYGVYFGCVLMLLVWSGLVFIAVRDHAFLAYFGYVATLRRVHDGEHRLRVPVPLAGQPALGQRLSIVLLCLSLITALEFSTTILRARDYTPRLNTVARVLQVTGGVAIALTPFIEYAVLIRPVTFLILFSVIFMIALGIICLLAGSRPARFYVDGLGRVPRRLASSSC